MVRASVGLVLFAVVLICNEASAQSKTPGRCPSSEQTFGICTYDPNVNCLDDSQCQGGKLCCSNGCNKICKEPVKDNGREEEQKPTVPQQCPKPSSSGSFGICSFDASVNCLDDNQCKNGQMCCSEGCNKVCKDPVKGNGREEEQKPIVPQQCPKPSSSGSFGICSFDASVNCLDNNQCKNGQMCCSEGCNKICKDPVKGNGRDDEQKPTGPPPGIMIKQCPKPSGSGFGICSYDESANCLDDSQCTNGQMCCSEGCNKVCKEPVTFQPIKPEPKVPGMQVNKAKGKTQ